VELAGDDELTLEATVGDGSAVSGKRPVEATKVESAGANDLTSEAIVGDGSSVSGKLPVEATKVELGVDEALKLEAMVGEGSSTSGRRPVDATNVGTAGADDSTLEGAVGDGSSVGMLPPVEATKELAELVVAVVESFKELDSLLTLLDAVELDTPVPLLKVKLEGLENWSLEDVLGVGCTSLLGMGADDGCCLKFSPLDPVLRLEAAAAVEDDEIVSDAVGDTMSSLLGMPTEGCLEDLSLELEIGAVGCTSLLVPGPTDGLDSTYVELVVALELGAVGDTSLLGAGPTDGLDSTYVELVVALELDAVGDTSLLGAGPTDGCCASLSPDRFLLLVDDAGEELGAVGSTVISGDPLEGVLEMVISSVLGSYSSLLEVDDVKGEELGAVGSRIVSGNPVDGCVDSVEVVG